jgi:hypothetical protein
MRILIFLMTVWFSIGPGGGLAEAQPQTPAFYEAASKIRPEGVLGQIVGQESIPTPVAGAQAWRIAYVSSDVTGRKTIVTGLVVAPWDRRRRVTAPSWRGRTARREPRRTAGRPRY